MNRREFVRGLLATAVAVPVAKVAVTGALRQPAAYFLGEDGFWAVAQDGAMIEISEGAKLKVLRDCLLPGLWEIAGRYPAFERQWEKIFADVESA